MPRTSSGGGLSGSYWNGIYEDVMRWAASTREKIHEEIMADGYPPLSYPLSPVQQYQRLLAMRAANDPRYWGDPEAQMALSRFAERYGEPGIAPLATGDYLGGGVAL